MKYKNVLLMAAIAGMACAASSGVLAGEGLKRPAVLGGPFGMLVPATQTRVVEELQDGGFEASTLNVDHITNAFWSGSSTNYVTPFCDEPLCGIAGQNGGSFWAWFGWGDVPESASVAQTVLIPAGGTATLSFYLSTPDCAATSAYSFSVTLDATEVFGFDDASPYADCNNPGYTQVSVDISDFAGTAPTLTFAATLPDDEATNFYVDDVAIAVSPYNYFRPGQATILPPPATDCDAATADHFGRVIADRNSGELWVCTDAGWGSLTPAVPLP